MQTFIRNLALLFIFCFVFSALVISCKSSKEPEPAANVNETGAGAVQPQELRTLPDVVFLPPIGDSAGNTADFDADVEVTIEIFDLVDSQAVGTPVGPTLTTKDGTIKVNNKYHANWKTSDSNKDGDSIVRVELRLDTAPTDAPACNDGADANVGCVAYFDAQLWKNKGQVKKNGGDKDDILDLTNGQTLPIKFHIKEGAANVSPIVEITSPANNAKFTPNDEVTITAKATDLEDGDLSAQVTWSAGTDTIDLGTEATASITTQLPVGTHVITASVTDSNGANGTSSITVEIVPPLPESWQSVNIGGTGISSYDSETETFELSTNAIDTAEGPSTQYAYQEVNHDFLAEGCIESLTNNPTVAAGLLLSQDDSAIAAPYLYAFFSQDGTKVKYQTKTVTQVEGAEGIEEVVEISEVQEIAGELSELPVCFRVEKVADEVSIYELTDQTEWKLLGAVTITFDPVLAGLFVSTSEGTAQAQFSNVVIESYTPPQAAFTAIPTSGEVPLTVEFDASSSIGTDLSYTWDFGDGNSGTGQQVSHTYQDVGEYQVTLTVNDDTRQSTASEIIETTMPAVSLTLLPVGAAANVINLSGGIFEVVVVLKDANGNLINESVEIDNISFNQVSLAKVESPSVPTTTATAEPVRVVTIEGASEPISLMIDVDASGSMNNSDPQNLYVDAAKGLIDVLSTPDEVAVRTFAETLQVFTTDYVAAKNAVANSVNKNSGSDTYISIINSLYQFDETTHPTRSIVVLTDGVATGGGASDAITLANTKGVNVYAIGLGDTTYHTQLQKVAEETGGVFAVASQPEDLARVFAAVGDSITENRTKVVGEVVFDTPLTSASGIYVLSGNMLIAINNSILQVPFSFEAKLNSYPDLPPIITAIAPDSDLFTGGKNVIITGKHFTTNLSPISRVEFDTTRTGQFTINSDTQITVRVPSRGQSGTVPVTLTTPRGRGFSNPVPFTYLGLPNQVPVISSFSVSSNETLLNQEVIFSWQVSDDDSDPLNCKLDMGDGNRITIADCRAVSSQSYTYTQTGNYTVKLTVSDGKDARNNTLAIKVTEFPAPVVSGITPNKGSVEGGTTVTITGSNFTDVTGVDFGGTAAESFTLVSDTEITATSPAGSEGVVGVTVSTPSGTSDPINFTYAVLPIITNISPTEGSVKGGAEVTITGRNFTGTTEVSFGGILATEFDVVSDTEVTATSPAGSVGGVDVTVATASGESNAVTFEYINNPPVINSFSASKTTVDLGEEIAFNWSVEDFDGGELSCVLDLGSYRGYDLGVFETDDCSNITSFTYSYFTSATYSATLEVTDSLGLKNTEQITINVSTSSALGTFTQVPFTTPEIQSIWTQVINRSDFARLDWQFDIEDPENAVALQNGEDIMLLVSEVGEPNIVIVMASQGEIFGLQLWSINVEADTLSISNVLEARFIKLENISRFQDRSLTDEEFLELAKQFEELTNLAYLESLFGWNDPQVQSLQSMDLCRDCSPERDTYYRLLSRYIYLSVGVEGAIINAGYRCYVPGSGAACFAGLLAVGGLSVGWFYAAQALIQARQELYGCLRVNEPALLLEKGPIAFADMPVLGLVFIRNIVTGDTVYTGYGLTIEQALYAGKDNAIATFISLTDFKIADRNGDKKVTRDDVVVNESLFQIEANWEATVDPDKQCF